MQAATEAATRGLEVIGIDAGAVGDGASGRNGGFLLAGAADFHHVLASRLGAAHATALYERTMAELTQQLHLTPDAVRRVGSIRLAASPQEVTDCARQAAAMSRDGLEVEEVSGVYGTGLRFPHDAAMHPGRRCASLAAMAVTAGVQLWPHTPAFRVAGHRVIARGCDLDARVGVLVAIDGGLDEVVPELAKEVRTARAQMLATAMDVASEDVVPCPMYSRWGYDYWQRLPDGRLVVGGGRDIGGDEEWTAVDGVTPAVQSALEDVVGDLIGDRVTITHRWSGRIGFTPSRLPICRLLEPGLAVAGGYCGTGNVIGPMAAKAALGLLVDGTHPDAPLFSESDAFG